MFKSNFKISSPLSNDCTKEETQAVVCFLNSKKVKHAERRYTIEYSNNTERVFRMLAISTSGLMALKIAEFLSVINNEKTGLPLQSTMTLSKRLNSTSNLNVKTSLKTNVSYCVY